MKNQQEQKNLNNLDNNIYYNEKIMLEYLNSNNSLCLHNSICYPNSSLNLILKENINSLRQNEINIEKENNVLTNESFKNILSDEKALEQKEKNLNNNTHLFKVIEVINPELKSTEDIISDNNTKNNKNKFETRYYNNRGKKPKPNDKKFLNKKHNRGDFDNLQTKIQVHCINFLINFVNNIVHTVFNSTQNSFKNINYQDKMKVNHSYIINLLQNPIKEIITKDITKKYKTLKDKQLDYNKNLYKNLAEKSKWFKDFLDMKYINFFHFYYYYNKKPLKIVTINSKTISVSNKTKSFHYLLGKEKELNKEINDLVRIVYFNGYNKENPFITTKCDK